LNQKLFTRLELLGRDQQGHRGRERPGKHAIDLRRAREEGARALPERDARPIVQLLQSCLGGDHEIDAAEVREASPGHRGERIGGLLPGVQLPQRREPIRLRIEALSRSLIDHEEYVDITPGVLSRRLHRRAKQDERPDGLVRVEHSPEILDRGLLPSRRGDHRAVSVRSAIMPLGYRSVFDKAAPARLGRALHGGEAATR
jgi:hypothetical protein